MKPTDRLVVSGVDVRYWFDDVQFICSWPRRGRSEVRTTVQVESTGVGGGIILPRVRVNLLSHSGRSSLFRNQRRREDLNAMWTHVIGDLLSIYLSEISDATNPDPRQHRENRKTARPRWLVYPFWPAEGATGIVASHEALKTYSGIAAALSVTLGENLFGGNARVGAPVKTLYLDWEADVGSFVDRMAALLEGAELPLEPVLTHMAMRESLVDAVPSLIERIQVGGYGAVVIDSMSASIGGAGLVGDDSVNAFWDAVRALAVPALVLAHRSAYANRQREARFFGSVMSEARVRMAWAAEVEDTVVGADVRRVLWTCFKDSNFGLSGSRLAWEWQFFNEGEHDSRHVDSVSIEAINPNAVTLASPDDDDATPTRRHGRTWQSIVSHLERAPGAVTKPALVQATKAKPNTVQKTLARMLDAGVIVKVGDVAYALASKRPAGDLPDPY